MQQEVPKSMTSDESFYIQGQRCNVTRKCEVNGKGEQKQKKEQVISYPSKAQENQIHKIFEISLQNKIITLEDYITICAQNEKPNMEAEPEEMAIKPVSNPEDNPRNKKVVLLKESLFGGTEHGGKNDKKNIVKNVINAYLKYLRGIKEEGKDTEQQINLLKDLINAKKYNNQLVTSIITEESLRNYFKRFLVEEANAWLERSKIKNKGSYDQAIKVYQKLCDREDGDRSQQAPNPSSGSNEQKSPAQGRGEKISSNSLSCFRELENHELEDELELFK